MSPGFVPERPVDPHHPLPNPGTPILESVNLRDADAVVRTLEAAAHANFDASCRRGSIDVIDSAGAGNSADAGVPRLIATGDLHDNPLHLMRLVRSAGMEISVGASEMGRVAHLTLHELIHAERLTNGMDFSYRVLTRVAALKIAFPTHVHTLLANHELSQLIGSLVTKDGVRCNEAFDDALDHTFVDNAPRVREAVKSFIRSMPLALRIETSSGTILCAHSLPGPELMDRFDPGVLERPLSDEDLVPRRGSAHLMVWGRGHTPEQLKALGERWKVDLFILGHEKAADGALVIAPNALVLNSDHERGVCMPMVLDRAPSAAEGAGMARPLAEG